ncbi:MAG TPA: ribonuclease E/G [Devosia sp.]|nr:ribonuclease E/G [Devosia sp.]
MATKRMLVDAIHPEETRIVVTSGNKLEEFDFESQSRRQLRGNIYLAKVTRVEPSLQAAFVEYGGNRHGFLAFSEIHPDYYQIPVADREALLRDEEEEERAEAEASQAESVSDAADGEDEHDENGEDASHIEQAPHDNEPVEQLGSGDALEDIQEQRRRTPPRRNYKIQEVIKRRQVMLVQVVKEERGNKGAALTTYLSLAGRYSVLMPNTARGGGISRKITNAADRKRLKEIVGDLEVPPGQGIILRTAGATRTKAEVKRDFEYLQRLWENVRSLTLQSQAPCLVYEEGSLIKRTIRDLYNKDIDEVLVAGEDAYREAKDFMKMIMPSHAKNVQLYKDDQPIFSKYNVEGQLDQMFSPQVTLPSGGYLVINPTEALVSIDVNSGRSTKEHNIEDTALQTNLEAADEVARQLRLRDLAGLIVIDFIDMMENRSNRAVERRLKEALKNDRARIQVGRISHFGLMEMSRQRIRFGVVESSTHVCPTCAGTGIVRSVESLALMVMRQVEDHVLRRPGQSINVKVPTDVALYILNGKRATLGQLEAKYGLSITIVADEHVGASHYAIEKGEPRPGTVIGEAPTHIRVDSAPIEDIEIEEVEETEDEAEEAADTTEREANGEGGGRRRRRRRRGRGGERGDERRQPQPQVAHAEESAEADEAEETGEESEGGEPQVLVRADAEGEPRRRRRRGRRGGRRNRREGEENVVTAAGEAEPAAAEAASAEEFAPAEQTAPGEAVAEAVPSEAPPPATAEAPAEPVAAEAAEAKPKRTRTRRAKAVPAEGEANEATPAAAEPVAEAAAEAKPKRTRTRKAKVTEETPAAPEAAAAAPVPEVAAAPAAAEPSAAEPVASETAPAEAAMAEESPSRRRRKELPAEGIVVSSTSAPEEGAEPPKKKAGWWQRGFFGS